MNNSYQKMMPTSSKKMSWSEEMNRMLAAFQQQTMSSLDKIEMAHNGLLFNDAFKQYFLRVSNSR